MAAAGHDMREVELVEGDGAPGARPLDGGGARSGGDAVRPLRSRARGHRRAATALGLVVASGLVVGDAAADARARAERAALGAVPGVVAPLDLPVAELWRGDPTLRPELGEAGGHLVGVMGARGAADVVGLDPLTGRVAWRTVLRDAAAGDHGGGVRCVVPEPAADQHPPPVPVPTVVCVVDRAVRPGGGTGPGPGREPEPDPDADVLTVATTAAAPAAPTAVPRHTVIPADRLLALDARTGAVLADRTVERSTVLAALGPDVVVGHVDDDGYVHVVRTDPLGEDVRWSFVTSRPLPRSHLAWATRIVVDDDVVVVDETDGWVLSADGRVLHSWTGATTEQLAGKAEVVGGGRYLARPMPTGGPWPRSELTDLHTGRTFAVAGRPLPTWPDDGTVDDRVLVRTGGSGGLVAHDPAGSAVWSLRGSVQGRALLVDGRLLRIGSVELSAVDARSGALLWSTPVSRPVRTSLVTDGRLAVATRMDPDLGVVLSAYGLDDGRPRWTVDLTDDIGAVVPVGDRLFGWTGERLVALGRPAG